METLYVLFKVEVSNNEYSYSGQRGEAEMKIQVPRSLLEHLDPGTLLVGVLSAALANYDTADQEATDKEEADKETADKEETESVPF